VSILAVKDVFEWAAGPAKVQADESPHVVDVCEDSGGSEQGEEEVGSDSLADAASPPHEEVVHELVVVDKVVATNCTNLPLCHATRGASGSSRIEDSIKRRTSGLEVCTELAYINLSDKGMLRRNAKKSKRLSSDPNPSFGVFFDVEVGADVLDEGGVDCPGAGDAPVPGPLHNRPYNEQRGLGPAAQPLSNSLVEVITTPISSRLLKKGGSRRIVCELRYVIRRTRVNQATAAANSSSFSVVHVPVGATAIITLSSSHHMSRVGKCFNKLVMF
jgi:hypothetical protein